MSNIETRFANRATNIINYKKSHLSLPNTPIQMIGSVEINELAEILRSVPMLSAFPGRSTGFANMSEFITSNDLDQSTHYTSDVSTKLNTIINTISTEVKKTISNLLGQSVIVVRGVIDTIDKNSCIIPHSDGFVFHKLSFRVHVPVFITEKSIGVNFDPWTSKPYSWKMKTVGGIYLFNNFEPHTVSVLDEGTRAHLIFDVTVADLFDDCRDNYTTAKQILSSRGEFTTDFFGPNTITHTISNYTVRNTLGKLYAGIEPSASLIEQASPESTARSLKWIKGLLNFELDNGNVRQV